MSSRKLSRPLGPAVAGLLLAVLLVSLGCGGAHRDVVATVGGKQITLTDYEDYLSRMKRENLPRDDDGKIVDTATLDGKKRFLDVVIDKELMALKAKELGFDADKQVQQFRNSFTDYRAAEVMHQDLVDKPASVVTDQQIQDFYDRLKQKRTFHFLVCNFKDDALKARQKLIDGALWEDVADEYNVGSRGPKNDYTFTIEYGRQQKIFEDALFSMKVGEISQPLQTVYGYWIVRLDEIKPNKVKPLDDHYKELIRRSIVAHQTKALEDKFTRESERKHDFKLDETGLWIIYQGLPEHEAYLDSVTKKPIPKEQLQPLDVPFEDMDHFFMSCRFDLNKDPESWTVGDYKALFDNMSTFARPKKSQLLGGVRNKIVHDMVDRRLLVSEARERGYLDDPRVTGAARDRVEEMMVTKLHDELVKVDEKVSPAQIDSFWQEHHEEYVQPELREGHIIYCEDEQSAHRVQPDLRGGKTWPELLRTYGVKMTGAEADGTFKLKATDKETPEKKALFGLAATGDLSAPFATQGKWAVVRLDKITPEKTPTLAEMRDAVKKRILNQRRDKMLRGLLDQWRKDYGVKVNVKVLQRARSWEQLPHSDAGPGAV